MIHVKHSPLRIYNSLAKAIKKMNVKNINSHNVCAAKIRWKFQKSGDNDQKLTYFKNLEKPDQCPVRAILNIAFRALRLKVDTKGPLAVHATGASTS